MYITNILLTEFDQELHDRCTREAGYEEGVADGMAEGITQDKLEGMAEGAQQNAIANARSLYQNGVSIEIIAKSLGMSIEQVQDIIADVVQA